MFGTSARSGFRRGCGRASWRPPSDLVDQAHDSGALTDACTRKGPQMANPRPTPKPENLRPPWPPGTSGNPAGYSRGRRISDAIERLIEEMALDREFGDGNRNGAGQEILPWHRRSSSNRRQRGECLRALAGIGLVCARMRNFLAGVIHARSSGDTIPNCLGEFREIKERAGIATYGHRAGTPEATDVERLGHERTVNG